MFAGDRRILDGRLATGALLGLTTFHDSRHIYRAVLEGTAYELRRQLKTIAPSIRLRRIGSVGGGTQSRLWTQIVTDILDAPQRCYPETLGAPFGDAYLGGLGIGALSGYDSLRCTWLRAGYEVAPQPERREAYDRAYQTYLDALRLLGIGAAV
jgi:xylulokinase